MAAGMRMARIILAASLGGLLLAGCGPSIGDACTTDQDCGGRTCVSNKDMPGGYCTQRCVLGDSGSCPSGSTCVAHHGDNLCLRTCSDNTECRSGYICNNFKNQGTFCLSPSDD